MRIDGLGFGDILDLRADVGVALLLEDVEAENHVGGRQRRTVGEPGLGAQAEGDRVAVWRKLRRLRDEPVDCVGLVEPPRHQGVEQKLQPLCGVALQDEAVEAVEGGARGGTDHRQPPTLGRIGVHPIEVLEVGVGT